MRIIPTKIHGILDYLVGIVLIAAPWLLGFAGKNAATYVPVGLGAAAILYSLLTDYEWGLFKFISMPVHLTLDLLSGILLALSPWLFGFSHQVYLPHLAFGVLEIIVSLMTDPMSYQTRHSFSADVPYGKKTNDLPSAVRPSGGKP